ncbi:MAG: hypothetical protein QOE61_601, partial [Micromonosporaceae bacterium]|nr:hypothetical protein [Micromonosporaceae bacterium]
EDPNIFIGECKVWTGIGALDEALEQIFKYLVWRDTKAAILLFIRNMDVTAVIKKALEKIEAIPTTSTAGLSTVTSVSTSSCTPPATASGRSTSRFSRSPCGSRTARPRDRRQPDERGAPASKRRLRGFLTRCEYAAG